MFSIVILIFLSLSLAVVPIHYYHQYDCIGELNDFFSVKLSLKCLFEGQRVETIQWHVRPRLSVVMVIFINSVTVTKSELLDGGSRPAEYLDLFLPSDDDHPLKGQI